MAEDSAADLLTGSPFQKGSFLEQELDGQVVYNPSKNGAWMFSFFTLRKLRSEDSEVRRSALERLKSLDNASVLEEVIRIMIEDPNGSTRDEAEKALERTKPGGAPERLKLLLGHQNPHHRSSAARTLHGIGWTPATARERAELAVGLGKCDLAALEGEAAIEPLSLEVATAKNQGAALDALTAIGEPAVPRLLDIFGSSNQLALTVARSVAKRADNVSEIFFVQALKNPNANTAALCRSLAEKPVPGTTPALIGLLKDSSKGTQVREAAISALAKSGSEAAVSALRAISDDPDKRVVCSAFKSLSDLKVPVALASLLDLLQSLRTPEYDGYRPNVVTMLGEIGDPRATGLLIELLEGDSYEGCRESCALALGKIGDKDAIIALEKVPFPKGGKTKYELWAAAQEALNEIGGQKGKWRAECGPDVLQEAVALRIMSNDPNTAVAKVVRQEDKRPFKVCGMVKCRQCGTSLPFQVSAGAGVSGATLQCDWCQSQMSLLISKHPQFNWNVFFVCGSPLVLRGGERQAMVDLHIRAVG